MSDSKLTAVLAHGAWADGSSWAPVIERLASRGIRAVAAPLPLSSLGDDAAALERSIERIAGPVVLVGHAYAGAVIGAAQGAKVAALVYVAALAPDQGETVGDVFYRAEPHALAPKLAPDAHGLIWLSEAAFASAFAQNATARELAVLAAIQRPIAAQAISEPVERPLWRDRPSWYLVAEQDRMISPDTQRFLAARMHAQVRTHAVDHTPSVTAPDAVSDLIAEAVRAVSDRA
jgi:pimeloyl-ACP methyl ester carboxylesterase